MINKPDWIPSKTTIENSNIYKMMQKHHFSSYTDFWKWSVTQKEQFWLETVANLGIKLKKPFTSILNTEKGVENPKWLYNSQLNIVDSCFQNSDNAVAIYYQDEGDEVKEITQIELEKRVNKIANSLTKLGLQVGDKVGIDMPMTVEAVAIYLACIKAGFPVVTIADSFTPNEIAIRLKITNPKVVFTQDFIVRSGKQLDLYQKVVAANASKIIVLKKSDINLNLRKQDVFWDDFLIDNSNFTSVSQSPEDVITILFSSGTTGEPKAIPWTHTTPIKGASDGYYHQDIHQNDVVCWPTNLGWMMGPWLVFAALINKATIALYYGAPTDSSFGNFVEKAKVTMLGVIPSFVKHWKNTKSMEQFNWDSIKCFSSTGEVSNPKEMQYLMQLANNKPVIEYCGGTEIGGGYVTSTVVQPNIASTFSTQALGGAFLLLDENNNEAEVGELFIVPPIVGLSTSLINRNHHEVYYKGTPSVNNLILRRHGDALIKLENGYYKAQGRIDDAMNLGGIKVSSVQIEAIVNQLSFVRESAAIAVSPKDGGPSLLVIYYVENNNDLLEQERLKQVKQLVKNKLNPLFKVSDLVKIAILPRTASNKIMRRKLRDTYQSK